MNSNKLNKLDIVYTYVNNTDKKWINKLSKNSNIIDKSRFNFNGEIFFSLLTVQKFFSWVNNIYIVNDDQVFDISFINKDFQNKIKFIDHKEIIPLEYLPTFNSHVIECYLWKIKNLSDFFIFLNDDMFFGNYVYYNDFFTKENIFKIFSTYRDGPIIVKNNPYFKTSSDGVSRDTAEIIFNKKFNTKIYISSMHMSWNLNKIACEFAFNIFNKYIKSTSLLKIRKYNNYKNNILNRKTISFLHLSCLMEYYLGIARLAPISSLFFHKINDNNIKNLFENSPKIFCINDLDEDCIENWNKIQNKYLNLKVFKDKYEELKIELKKKINKLE